MKKCIDCDNEYPLSYFYKNKKMPDGHLNSCKACRRKWDNEYKKQNKEILSIQTKVWKEDNKDKVKSSRQKHYSTNSEKELLLNKEWRRVNKERVKVLQAKSSATYRASKRNATPWWSDMEAIRDIYEHARRLTLETGIQYHVDHIVPLVNDMVQGLHVPANLRIIPWFENVSKGNKLIEDIVLS